MKLFDGHSDSRSASRPEWPEPTANGGAAPTGARANVGLPSVGNQNSREVI